MSKIRFRFIYRPEFLQVGDRFIFREGTTRGVGIVRNLYEMNKEEDEVQERIRKNNNKRGRKAPREMLKVVNEEE